mmetsp:Transcript_16602/g.40891  ORF Transcript_16602/g.40891 Transcript_16602/m.40891 type:complete len:435 (-) Transcript_16602:255-1559(-)
MPDREEEGENGDRGASAENLLSPPPPEAADTALRDRVRNHQRRFTLYAITFVLIFTVILAGSISVDHYFGVEENMSVVLVPSIAANITQPQSPSAPDSSPLSRPSNFSDTKIPVALMMVGYLNYFLDPRARVTMVEHLLEPLKRTTELHSFLCTDTMLIKHLPEGLLTELGITLFHKRFPGRRQFFRKHWCHQQLTNFTTVNNLKFKWLVQTRPDLVYFGDVPDLRDLPDDRLYGRMRAAGQSYAERWNLSSFHFSHAFSNPNEVGCWGKMADWQGECVIVDDQFNYIPWKYAERMNVPGAEWGGFRRNRIPFGETRRVAGVEKSDGSLDGSLSYSMCKAAFPGEGFFTRAMVVGGVPFQPLALNACLGKNVWHPRRKRWDCSMEQRVESTMKQWFKTVSCPKNTDKPLFEEWESFARLCNESDKEKYTGNAGC